LAELKAEIAELNKKTDRILALLRKMKWPLEALATPATHTSPPKPGRYPYNSSPHYTVYPILPVPAAPVWSARRVVPSIGWRVFFAACDGVVVQIPLGLSECWNPEILFC
jgi:hypothetical protein